MKIPLTITFLILLMQIGYSQNSNDKPLYRSIGIDINFINNFLPLDNPIGSRGNYLFHYVKYKENNKFFKHGLDLDLFGGFQEDESEVDRDDFRIDLDYKISRGKRSSFFKKKGYVLFGPELSVGYFLNQVSISDPSDPSGNNFNNNTDQRFSGSLGPFVGIGYHITKRISLYTEAGASLRFSYELDTFNSDSMPSNDFKDRRFIVSTRYILPSSLVLFFHF